MRAIRAVYMRVVLSLLIATTLVTVFASGASAAPPPSLPCQNTTMQPYLTGDGGGFIGPPFGTQFNVEVYLYQRWDPAAHVWCGGFQTRADFEVDSQMLTGLCPASNLKTQVRQYRNGVYNSINGPTISDCDVYHDSGFVPGLPDVSSGTFYGWANFSVYGSTAAITPTHTQ